jgi:transcriptional regulator with XRE-family HTH domain
MGKDATRSEIGSRIRALRVTRGMTGKKLAEEAQISPAFLSEVERGQSAISSEKLVRIASALGVDVQDLLSSEMTATSKEMVSIPVGLSEAATELHLTYSQTLKILDGFRSLTARRSSGAATEWNKQDWIKFCKSVMFIFTDKRYSER